MIKEAKLRKELVVAMPNKVGILADMSKIMADHGINIEGACGYAANNEAKIMLVVDDVLRGKEALQKGGYKAIKENEVIDIVLENKPGALKVLTAKLAKDNIDIKYTYGSVCAGGCPARIIVATTDNEKALVSLKAK